MRATDSPASHNRPIASPPAHPHAPQRANHTATLVQPPDNGSPEIWIVGGQDSSDVVEDCWVLELEGLQWRQVPLKCAVLVQGWAWAPVGCGLLQVYRV